MATQIKAPRRRAPIASELIATLDELVPLGHPARPVVRQLQQLFGPRDERIREMLDRVPGKSLAAKAARLGMSRGAVWAIWNGRYRPSPEIARKIEAAAEQVDA